MKDDITRNDDPQDRIDRSIGRALDALAHQDGPAPGFDTRILQALAERRTDRQSSRFAGWPAMPVTGWGVAIACMLAVAALPRYTSRSRPAAQGTTAERTARHVNAPAKDTATTSSQTRIAAVKTQDSAKSVASSVPGTTIPAPAAQPFTSAEQAMLDDLHAPSRPAPPLPLTAAERAMVQVVHRGDPVQVADLDPRHRADVAAVEQAEIDSFFYVPPPQEDDHSSLQTAPHTTLALETPHASPRPHSPPTLDARHANRALRARGARRTDA